jgi:hypothetical protein
MAIHIGNEGTVSIGGTTVGQIKGFTINENVDTVEKTVMGDSSKSFLATHSFFAGTIDVLFDEDDTGQTAMTVGSTVSIEVFPEGNSAGKVKFNGNVIITGDSLTSTTEGLVEKSFDIQGTGGLTRTTV